jgi:hypothetical protein
MIGRRRRRGHSSLAVAFALPPDTPDNVVITLGWWMHAVNRGFEVKKQFEMDHPGPKPSPPLASAKPADREQQHDVTLPPPPHV